jgi:hypothetical protein
MGVGPLLQLLELGGMVEGGSGLELNKSMPNQLFGY